MAMMMRIAAAIAIPLFSSVSSCQLFSHRIASHCICRRMEAEKEERLTDTSARAVAETAASVIVAIAVLAEVALCKCVHHPRRIRRRQDRRRRHCVRMRIVRASEREAALYDDFACVKSRCHFELEAEVREGAAQQKKQAMGLSP